MKTTRKDKYSIQDKMDKLIPLPLDQALTLLYAWVKQDAIDCSVFRLMSQYLKENK